MNAPRTILDIHVIQTVPPSNLNRDDTGSPKSAIFGGARRARVSSQSWKRAIRTDFQTHLDASQLGVRTKRLVELVATTITDRSPDVGQDRALELAGEVLKAGGISVKAPRKPRKTESGKAIEEADALAFLSRAQIGALAEYALAVETSGDKVDAKEAKRLADTQNSVDIGLFGRMVASDPSLNVDAACQVAHALSTHAVSNEYDYYTAVDDEKSGEESLGAGMVGVIEYNSATLYRYASLDVQRLTHNLGDAAATGQAVRTFLRSMMTSMPSGKQATFANRTLPDAALIALREDQPVSFVGAFERPVTAIDGRVAASIDQLVGYAAGIADTWGAAATQTWVICPEELADTLGRLGERGPMPSVIDLVGAEVDGRFAAS